MVQNGVERVHNGNHRYGAGSDLVLEAGAVTVTAVDGSLD
jgi:hypothetical protein